MSNPTDQLRDDLRTAIDAAKAELPLERRDELNERAMSATQHVNAGRNDLAAVDLLTIETLLFTWANDRAKRLRADLFAAVLKAAINGIVLA